MQEDYLVTAQSKPSLLLNGETPRLIDEWQDIPVLWDSVRTMVDKRSKPGQFILTGSNTVPQDKIKHSGTGRIATLRMLPMSLWESKESSGQVSISELFNDADYDFDGATSKLSIEDLILRLAEGDGLRLSMAILVELTPEAKISLTPLPKIKMTPVDVMSAGDFICIFEFRFGRRGYNSKKT